MIRKVSLILLLAATTAGCAWYDDDFGSARYNGSTYLGGGYDGPGYDYGSGWYDGFWYPGTGFWIYDSGGGRHRWRDKDRDWWRQHRGDRAGRDRPPPSAWQGRRPDGWQGRPGGGQGNGEATRPSRWRGRPDAGQPPQARPPRGSDTGRPSRPDVRPGPSRDAPRVEQRAEPRAEPRERSAPAARSRENNPNERPD